MLFLSSRALNLNFKDLVSPLERLGTKLETHVGLTLHAQIGAKIKQRAFWTYRGLTCANVDFDLHSIDYQ